MLVAVMQRAVLRVSDIGGCADLQTKTSETGGRRGLSISISMGGLTDMSTKVSHSGCHERTIDLFEVIEPAHPCRPADAGPERDFPLRL